MSERYRNSVSPRILVRVTIYQPDGADRDVIGYAEFPRQTSIERTSDAEAFAEQVEEEANYCHWKPDVQISE